MPKKTKIDKRQSCSYWKCRKRFTAGDNWPYGGACCMKCFYAISLEGDGYEAAEHERAELARLKREMGVDD
jgi:hypothetical protein